MNFSIPRVIYYSFNPSTIKLLYKLVHNKNSILETDQSHCKQQHKKCRNEKKNILLEENLQKHFFNIFRPNQVYDVPIHNVHIGNTIISHRIKRDT